MAINKTKEFLQGLDQFRKTEMPKHVMEKLKMLLLDYIGVAIGGAGVQK